MTNIEEIPQTWCRMWNDDASLAHDLITADGRWWSGIGDAADRLVGPGDTERFVAGYQRDVGNKFTLRTPVYDGTDRIAFTWDVARPDGSVWSGADVCVLRDGKVALNWTLPTVDRRDQVPDPPTGRGSLERDAIAEVVESWSIGRDGVPDDRVFGSPHGSTKAIHGEPVIDLAAQTVAFTWSADGVGGIDVLVLDEGEVARAWSLAGTRAHVI